MLESSLSRAGWYKKVAGGRGRDYTRMYCLEEAGGTLENPELYCGANA